ncbi:MAG: zinc ribbon domain-containing protein [Zetaproteobacteria bacterium]|nr:MAG: zinc ribbon domain-containing protein [Zetaproteobacteria bacterium]
MPIYEYRCSSCGHEFETLVLRKDEAVACPQCQSNELDKLISAHAVGSAKVDTPCGDACAPAPMCGAGACPSCQ